MFCDKIQELRISVYILQVYFRLNREYVSNFIPNHGFFPVNCYKRVIKLAHHNNDIRLRYFAENFTLWGL